jgi:RNase P subunit RPR2
MVEIIITIRKLACPNCGGYKNKNSHTFASYKVYECNTVLTLKCKSCGYIQKFRYIEGGYNGKN